MSNSTNPSRERILRRIGSALRTGKPSANGFQKRPVFAPIENLLERFVAECKGNHTDCFLVEDSAREKIQEILRDLPAGEVFAEDCPKIRGALAGLERDMQWSSEGPPSEITQATITTADLLIAQTGSLLISSSCGGRGASVVAPVHIVVAGVSQLVADLDQALAVAQEQQLAQSNSFLGVITGCSRTGDIEKLLVIGAHGPKRLVVLVDVNG
jgi:L-lactate dehydrogenase complex protein LldG